MNMYGSNQRELGKDPVPQLPDGSTALLPIDQNPVRSHNLNEHGWPMNNVQEYLNTESEAVRDMMLQQMQLHNVTPDHFAGLSDAQKCALTPSRRSQTLSEFTSEQSRLDSVRSSFQSANEEVVSSSGDTTSVSKKSDEEIINNV